MSNFCFVSMWRSLVRNRGKVGNEEESSEDREGGKKASHGGCLRLVA